jgi:Zn-dependent peptidase ImmA (M78 family)
VIANARKAIAVARAKQLVTELGIVEPSEIDIERIAAFKNVLVRYEPLQGMDGRIVRDGDAAIVTVNNGIKFEGQRRFVIAHELGHFFLHPTTRQIETVNAGQTNNWSERQETEEYEANLFAAELLLQESLFTPRIKGKKPSFDLIEALAGEFKTTLTATAVQFVLKTSEECALVSSANRERLWFVLSRGFSFRMLEESFIHGRSCAAEVGADKRKSRSSQIEAGYWLEGYRDDQRSLLTEDARFFPSLNRSLSLLWIHDAI